MHFRPKVSKNRRRLAAWCSQLETSGQKVAIFKSGNVVTLNFNFILKLLPLGDIQLQILYKFW